MVVQNCVALQHSIGQYGSSSSSGVIGGVVALCALLDDDGGSCAWVVVGVRRVNVASIAMKMINNV